MKFLDNVHLPISLSKYLNDVQGCTCLYVNQILSRWNTTDAEISVFADQDDFVVISKDADFKATHFIKGTPRKLVRIALGNLPNSELLSLFEKYLPFILDLDQKPSFFVEVSREMLTVIE